MALAAAALPADAAEQAPEFFRVYRPYSDVVFYDGYNDNIFDKDLDDGILRHRNSLYAKRLTDKALDWFGLETRLDVNIRALCDNYDRIGNV